MAKTKIIHVAVEPSMRSELMQRAKLEGLTPSAIIRIAIRRFLEERTPVAQSKQEAV